MNYDHHKKFGLLKFHSGYGKFNLNSPKGYSLKIINAQTVLHGIIDEDLQIASILNWSTKFHNTWQECFGFSPKFITQFLAVVLWVLRARKRVLEMQF